MTVEVETVRAVEVPTRLVHGPGAVARLGELVGELGVTRPMLVTDPGVTAAGLTERALEHLDDAVVFGDVRPNPDIALVDRGAELYASEECDGLVALGGGSSMDTAKSIGVVARHGGSILRYEWGNDPIEQRIPPLVAIPTTAGTGSEVTIWAVITDHDRKIKFNVGGTPLIGPHVALIDPELMVGLPAAVTAATGMDALSHAIECYTCDYHQPFNDAVALHAMELVAEWLRIAVEDGSNLEARTQMAHAATLGGMAYGTESVPKVHKIFGPGNAWVTAAKELVAPSSVTEAWLVEIDVPAGKVSAAPFATVQEPPASVLPVTSTMGSRMVRVPESTSTTP